MNGVAALAQRLLLATTMTIQAAFWRLMNGGDSGQQKMEPNVDS